MVKNNKMKSRCCFLTVTFCVFVLRYFGSLNILKHDENFQSCLVLVPLSPRSVDWFHPAVTHTHKHQCSRRVPSAPFSSVLFGQTHFLCSSAKLKPGGRLNGIQQFVPHQVLVAEFWQLEQVHAGAGGRQALQVAAAIVDAEDWVKFLCHPKNKKNQNTFKIKKTNWLQRRRYVTVLRRWKSQPKSRCESTLVDDCSVESKAIPIRQ